MNKRKYSGRYFVTLGAIALVIWAGYECWVRLETLSWAFSGIKRLCTAENIPFMRALGYFDKGLLYLTAYLLLCALFSLIALILRNKPRAGYVLLTLDLLILIAGFSLGLFGLSIFSWMQSLKILPLLLMGAGWIINLCHFYLARQKDKGWRARMRSAQTQPSYQYKSKALPRRQGETYTGSTYIPPRAAASSSVRSGQDLARQVRQRRRAK